MHRRRFAAALATFPLLSGRVLAEPAAERLRAGGCAVLLRHALTTPGVGDPPGFTPGDCRTQRNLSEEGRVQARRIGEWFAAQGLRPRAVRTSAWCRCIDTAQLAFGRATPWPPLDSLFNERALTDAANRSLRDALAGIAPGAFEVWVTHQVNITALTGAYLSMGEGLVLDAGAHARERLRFGAA
ncbi:MAG: histidine phosphatase family protein [Variovorax sp.]